MQKTNSSKPQTDALKTLPEAKPATLPTASQKVPSANESIESLAKSWPQMMAKQLGVKIHK